jgi:hypothetical protein
MAHEAEEIEIPAAYRIPSMVEKKAEILNQGPSPDRAFQS